MGVEDGILWACQRGTVGICGYALIPAEGHPWSPQLPSGLDSMQEAEESRRALLEFDALRRQGLDFAEACKQVHGDDPLDQDYMDRYLDVHGGITYYVHPWVGFDTGHGCDVWPPEWDEHGICSIARSYGESIHWTPEMVYEEAKALARQVAEIGRSVASDIDMGAAAER